MCLPVMAVSNVCQQMVTIWSLAQTAALARARDDRHLVPVMSSRPLMLGFHEHAVAVGIEAVMLGYCVTISVHHVFFSRQRADQHQERRFR